MSEPVAPTDNLSALWAEIASSVGKGGWLLLGGPYDPVRGRSLPYTASIYTPPEPPAFEDGTQRPRDRWVGNGRTPVTALKQAECDWHRRGIHDGRHGTGCHESGCETFWAALTPEAKDD
jgi:hypothetical protein